jgi:hypothetical protein
MSVRLVGERAISQQPSACTDREGLAGAVYPQDRPCPKVQVARRELQLEVAIAKLDKFDLLILDDWPASQ